MRIIPAASILALLTFSASGALADDAAMFKGRCGACHQITSLTSGRAGPSLKGVVGRKIASLPDYNYSPALKSKGGTWTEANLDAWLAAPWKFAPGSKMYVTVADAADRAKLINYMKAAK